MDIELIRDEKMNLRKNKYHSNRRLILLIFCLIALPLPSFIAFMLIQDGEYYGAIFVLIIFFILPLLAMIKGRSIIYFGEKHFCYWSLFEGKCKIDYTFIYLIKCQLEQFNEIPVDRGESFTVCFYTKKGNKSFAKFVVLKPSYISLVLNYIQDKVDDNVIDNFSFEQTLRIRKIDGEYTYYYKKTSK